MAERRPRVELIENRGPNTLLSAFRTLLGKPRAVDIQAAFASADGVGALLPHFRRAAARGKVRIVTGLYQAVTEPAALWLLLKAQRQSKGRLKTRLARDLHFHRKLYLFRNGDECSVISGSSNMTGEGLKSSGEFNLLARLPQAAPQVRQLVAEFDHLWSSRTVPLSLGRIKHYASIRRRRPRAILPQRSLASIFGPASSDGVDNGDASSEAVPRYWRDWISGFAAARTEAIVTEETDWDRNRYWWYASQYDGFKTGDRMLLFDRATGWAEIAAVRATTRTATPTPDGRHFVAYVRARGWHRRRMGSGLWKALASVGLVTSADARTRRRRLTEGQWGRVISIFQK
jgi:HKD family nuclease